MSDTQKLESMIQKLQDMMLAGFEQIDKRFEQVDARFDSLESKVDTLDTRMQRLEDVVDILRIEMRRDESTATRALLNQAFEHISDQIAREDHTQIPSLIFRSRSRQGVPV